MTQNIEGALSDLMDLSPKTIRFYALRMIEELRQGKQLTPEAQRELYDVASLTKVREVFGESS